MIEFCQIIRNDHNKQIDYQGSNVETLCNMVNISGGYTLLPKYIAVQQRIEYGLHQLFKNGFNPGREIIAVYSNRTIKEDAIKTIISAVKTNFHSPDKEKIEIINWK